MTYLRASLLFIAAFMIVLSQPGPSIAGGPGGGGGFWMDEGLEGTLTVSEGDFTITVESYDGKPPDPLQNVFCGPWEDDINFTVSQIPFSPSDWIYFYRGDGTGFYIYDGTGNNPLAGGIYAFSYDFPDISRYNPTLIWKDGGGTHTLGLFIHDTLKNSEEPSPSPPNYIPPHTGNQDLDNVLSTLSLDNSDWRETGMADCICGKTTNNCRHPKYKIDVHECNAGYYGCLDEC